MVKAPHHKTQAQNAITKHYHQTQALMGATRPASGIKAKAYTPNKDSQTTLITRLSVSLCLKIPTRDASPPLVLAFGGSVWCLNPFYGYVSPDANSHKKTRSLLSISRFLYYPSVSLLINNHTHLDASRPPRCADIKFNLMNHYIRVLIWDCQFSMIRLLCYPTLHYLANHL